MQNYLLINELNAREQSKPIAVYNRLAKETVSKRDQLIQWLIQNTFQNKISLKTIELAVLYIDIFLNVNNISEQKFQLLAIGAFNLAAKFNQKGISKQTKIYDSNGIGIYQDYEYDQMEIDLLQTMQFQLNFITSSDYAELIGLNLQDEKIKSYFLFILLDFQIYKYQHIELALAILYLSNENIHQLQPKIYQISKVIQEAVNQQEKIYQEEDEKQLQYQSNLNKKRRIMKRKAIRKQLKQQQRHKY